MRYKKIHRIIFKHSIYAIILILSGFCVYFLDTSSLFTVHNLSNHSAPDKGSFLRTLQNTQKEAQYAKILIPYWESQLSNNLIINNRNLILHNNIIFPRFASVNATDPLINIDNFNDWLLSVQDIEHLANALITNTIKESNLQFHPISPLTKWIFNTFQLNCLTSFKVSDVICNWFLNQFYKDWALYNLSQSISELDLLSKRTKNPELLCETVYEATLYQRTHYPAFDQIIKKCSPEINDKYDTLVAFIEINQELDQNIFSSTTYPYADLNIYKLLSLQQTLHSYIMNKTFNISVIKQYLQFTQALLDRDNEKWRLFPDVYKDLTYRFNNFILTPSFQSNNIQTISFQEKSDLFNLVQIINKWQSAFWSIWLEKQILTLELLYRSDHVDEFIWQETKITDVISQVLYNPTLKLGLYNIDEENNSANFQWSVQSEKVLETLGTSLKIEFDIYTNKWNVLYLKDFKITSLPEFWDFLHWYLKSSSTFAQFLTAIDDYISIFEKEEEKQNDTLCTALETKNTKDFVSCNETEIHFLKKADNISYIFKISNNTLQSVEISNNTLNDLVQQQLANTLITSSTTQQLIQDILNQTITKVDACENVKLAVNNRVNEYLKTRPTSIQAVQEDSCDLFTVLISIQWINLEWIYSDTDQTIRNISLKVTRNNWEEKEIITIPITRIQEPQDLVFPLTEENRNTLAYIANNPKSYIRLFNSDIRYEYEQALKPIQ